MGAGVSTSEEQMNEMLVGQKTATVKGSATGETDSGIEVPTQSPLSITKDGSLEERAEFEIESRASQIDQRETILLGTPISNEEEMTSSIAASRMDSLTKSSAALQLESSNLSEGNVDKTDDRAGPIPTRPPSTPRPLSKQSEQCESQLSMKSTKSPEVTPLNTMPGLSAQKEADLLIAQEMEEQGLGADQCDEEKTDLERSTKFDQLSCTGSIVVEVKEIDGKGVEIIKAADVDIEFVDPLEKKYECPVCVRVLRYPVQFEECGHRCCSSCLPELLRIAPRCPIDQKTVARDKVFVDKPFTKEIDNLAVKCACHRAGCKWKGTLREFYPHYEDCKYLTIPCPRRCGAEYEKRFRDKHLRDDCPKRDMVCEFCKNTISVDEEITHLNVCKRFPIPCPNGCKKKEIPREELDNHMENDCSKQGIPCPFSECGCEHRGARKEMNKHIRDEPVKHLTLVGQTILAHKKTLEMHSEIMDQQHDRLDKTVKRVEGLEKLYGSQLIWKIDGYSAKLEEAKAGRKPTIFSPPFLTSRHGYKMAMSCCLYGDGKARGKNLSVFLCICKGEFDALLLWPFCHRVTFTLVDQCQDPEARRNVTYSVKPNTCKENKAFLGRPSGERNASFGAQKFCDLNILETLDYTRDDCLFIKVNIDTEDMVQL